CDAPLLASGPRLRASPACPGMRRSARNAHHGRAPGARWQDFHALLDRGRAALAGRVAELRGKPATGVPAASAVARPVAACRPILARSASPDPARAGSLL